MSLAAIILAATSVISLLGLYTSPRVIQAAVLRPVLVLRRHEYHRLVTSGFVHANLPHLLFNMLTFYFFAFAVERYIGPVRFFVLYFSGLVLSNIGTTYQHRDDPSYASLGASGAILAVMFASIIYSPHQSLMILPIPIPIPAPLFAVGYLVYSYYSSRRSNDRINHDAHIGGALTGLLFVAVTDPSAYAQIGGMIGL